MYDIVTLEPEDAVVMTAVDAIVQGAGAIPGPNGNYQFYASGSTEAVGDGGRASTVLVVVGHGGANSLSGRSTWKEYREDVGSSVPWAEKTRVYLAACSTAGGNGASFLHGNIAQEVKAAFPNAKVWASSSSVSSRTQSGDWQLL